MSEAPSEPIFEAPDPAWLGPLFPGYAIEGLVATGGMGAVYRAIQRSLDRPVAVKILPREFGADATFQAAFEAEAKAMARLNHPNLISVYDFGEVEGLLFIVMEFVPGKSLFHSAQGVAIEPREAARIVGGICHGLEHAHEHGILHRDIKPGNILLDQQARPKIGDFGLARPIGRAEGSGEPVFGTPHYTAPEVVQAPSAVDERADIFSVGVVLHELLTGQLPADDPRPPSAICGCDPRFDKVVRRATHPSPALRYASAGEIAKELDALAASPQAGRLRTVAALQRPMPAAAGVMPAAVAPRPVVRSFSSAPVVVAGVVVVVAALVALAIMLTRDDPPVVQGNTPALQPAGLADLLPPAKQAPTRKEPAEPVAAAPDPDPEPEPVVSRDPPPASDGEDEMTAADQDPAGEDDEIAAVDPAGGAAGAGGGSPTPPAPDFDMAAFFDRARGIMRERATPAIEAHAKEVKANFDSFERRVRREVRRLSFARERIEPIAEQRLETWRQDGGRIPQSLEWGIEDDRDDRRGFGRGERRWGGMETAAFNETIRAAHREARNKQDLLDQKLELELLELAKVYIVGIEKEIERRVQANDEASAERLRAEIATTREDPGRFGRLMRGQDAKLAAAPEIDERPRQAR